MSETRVSPDGGLLEPGARSASHRAVWPTRESSHHDSRVSRGFDGLLRIGIRWVGSLVLVQGWTSVGTNV